MITKYWKDIYIRRGANDTPEFEQFKVDEAKAWLKHLLSLKSKVKTMRDELKDLKNEVGISGVEYTDMPKNPNVSDDAILNTVLLYEKKNEMLNDLISEYEKTLVNAEFILQSLKSNEYAYELINRHYLMKEPMAKTCRETCYSERQIRNILRTALLELYYLLPYTYKTPLPKAV